MGDTKYFFQRIVPAILFAGFLIFGAVLASAQNVDNIVFPVAELGNCASKEECKTYCDDPANMSACIDFAEQNGLMSEEEAERARVFAELGVVEGPGGCKSESECKNYCDDTNNIEECLSFAKKYNLMSKEELKEAEQVAEALKKGAKLPGGCTRKEECEAYCEEESHLEECLLFAEEAGFITPEEAEMARKTGGKGPGGCKGKEECDAYCEDPENMEQCINFAIEHDLMSPDKLEEARGMLQAIQSGVKPPDCKGEEECEIYCSDPAHSQECLDFAVAAGFIDVEEAEQARAMMERGITEGPGGCQSKEECEAYCKDPLHVDECMEFSVEAGFMTEEEAQTIREQMEQMEQSGGPGGGIGPGGCTTPEECEAYCQDSAHIEECLDMAVQSGMMTPEEAEAIMQGMEEGSPMQDMAPPEMNESMCDQFDLALSCDFVPEEFREMCEECRAGN